MVRVKLDGNPILLPALRSRSAYDSPTTPDRHIFSQCDFRGHGESYFDCGPFRQRLLGVKENSATTQILGKPRRSLSIEMNR